MDLIEILDQIPEYKEFMAIDELNASSKQLVNNYDHVDLLEIGKSREKRPIYCLKIGEGKKNALLFAFPHPNEPIGSMSLEFLSHFLARNPKFTKETGYTWYIIKAIDIDGAKLNEGWFKGDFTPIKYARNFYRPAGHEQVEWSFPIKYKKLIFETPPPETQALIKLMKEIKPQFMTSLHNSAFGGVYFYVTRGVGNIFADLIDFVKQEGLPLHLGEPETHYIKKLHNAVFETFGIQEMYDFAEANGIENPQEFIKLGNSSFEYIKSITSEDSFVLVCEIPYFYNDSINDTSLTDYERRNLCIQSLEYMKEIYKHSRKFFNQVKKFCDRNSRIYTAVADYMRRTRPNLDMSINDAKTSSLYDGKATVSQRFDFNIASRFYCLLNASMIARLCQEAILIHPENKIKIDEIKDLVQKWITQKIDDLLQGIEFKVIPIEQLVRVQIGSIFISLENLAE